MQNFSRPEQVFPNGTPYEQQREQLYQLIESYLQQGGGRIDVSAYPLDMVSAARRGLELIGWNASIDYGQPTDESPSQHLVISSPPTRPDARREHSRPRPPFPG